MNLVVIELPLEPRSCLDCEYVALNAAGSFCELFREPLDSEAADDCDGYTPVGS